MLWGGTDVVGPTGTVAGPWRRWTTDASDSEIQAPGGYSWRGDEPRALTQQSATWVSR